MRKNSNIYFKTINKNNEKYILDLFLKNLKYLFQNKKGGILFFFLWIKKLYWKEENSVQNKSDIPSE